MDAIRAPRGSLETVWELGDSPRRGESRGSHGACGGSLKRRRGTDSSRGDSGEHGEDTGEQPAAQNHHLEASVDAQEGGKERGQEEAAGTCWFAGKLQNTAMDARSSGE